jgi:hypothetical protein
MQPHKNMALSVEECISLSAIEYNHVGLVQLLQVTNAHYVDYHSLSLMVPAL